MWTVLTRAEQDRWLTLSGAMLSPSGTLTTLEETPEVAEGVTPEEGADQLTSQAACVRAEGVTAA